MATQQAAHTDDLKALNSLGKDHHHAAKVTPPALATEWLPWVHTVISKFKAFVLGAYHGTPGKYVQEYLNE